MNQTVFITGASAGIGAATASLFSQNGSYRMIITGRRKDKLLQLADQLKADVKILSFDVRDPKSVKEAIDSLEEPWKEIDILINNAGLAVGTESIDEGILDDWDRMIDTNVKGLLYVSRAIIPHMVKRKKGHIINLASIAGKEVYPGGSIYCATKHAVDALSRGMRIDLLPHKIKVTNIAPGAVETEFSIVRYKGDEKAADKVYQGYDPLLAEDIADVIYFAATRPPHVNINDLLIMPTAQASARMFHKE